MVVRRLLHSLGYRYRLHAKDLPGKPDIVFRRRKKVILIHGCFWHQHNKCREGRFPGTRQEYWVPKLGHSSQAKGRVERVNRTLQDRLEMPDRTLSATCDST